MDDYNDMKEEFKTMDITKITPLSRIMSMVVEPQRPGYACTLSSGMIHDDELHIIAAHLDVTKEQLESNLLQKSDAYNKSVFKPKIRKHQNKEQMPYGKCVFLDESKDGHVCKLGENKPLHCKLSTNSKRGHKIHIWYMLNYVIDPKNPEAIRQWALYLKSHPTIPGGELHELEPDAEKLKQILSYDILK